VTALRERLGPRVDATTVLDGLLLAVFGALSLWMVALSVWQVARAGAIWTGVDGVFPQDQMQYLAWIRDASRHGLSSNLFVLEPRPHDYLQPAIALSAGLTALGMAPWLALLLWKPVAVVAVFLAIRALVHRTVEGDHARLAVLALALFFTGWGALINSWLGDPSFAWSGITNELWVLFWSWGYPFGMLGLAAMMGALLAYARGRSTGRIGVAAPLLGALASWLHPWQGETLALILIGTEALFWALDRAPRPRQLLVTLVATALPLLYYVILGRADASWRLAQEAGNRHWDLWMILLSVAPLAIPAALAYRRRPATFLDAAVRLWPAAALVVFLVAQTPRASGALHAWLGIGVPLAILAAQGLRGRVPVVMSSPAFTAAAVLALVIPPGLHQLSEAHRSVHTSLEPDAAGAPSDARFLAPETSDALHWLLRDPRKGGVLTRPYLGTAVPAETGRATWVGNSYWSGGRLRYFYADGATRSLFFGPLDAADSRHLVRVTGARFVLADCGARRELRRDLASLVSEVHRFGCARVLVVEPPATGRR
jgi:hypothetical protein